MPITDLDRLVFYRRSDDRALVPLSSPTTRLGAGSISNVSGVPIGFSFKFDGGTFTTCFLAAYGFLRLSGAVTSNSNANLGAANTSVILAPWWDAMRTAITTGYIKTETLGTAPFRRFVAEWRNYLYFTNDATNNDTVTFQVVLYETTNRFDFRYGPRVRTGSPTTGSGSVGAKGNTTVTASNYRDLSVDTLALGGRNTALTTNLTYTTYDTLTTIVGEPAWPMSGRLFLLDAADLTGMQDPYGDPIWKLANAANWLWCAHRPPCIAFTPDDQTSRASVEYIVPVTPCADTQVTYTLTVQVYASTGTTCTFELFEDAAADPQPAVGGDWSSVASSTQAVSAGWNELSVAVPAFGGSYARLTVSVAAGNLLLGHAMMAPDAATDFDPTLTYASGWVPVSIALIRQKGAPVYAELYNRIWSNIALVLASRKQVLWSSVWPELALASLSATTAKPTRTIAVGPASLRTWRGQSVTVSTYSRATTASAPLRVGEDGGSAVSFTVDLSGGEYRLQSSTLDLVSDEPILQATTSPQGGGAVSPMATVVEWAPAMSSTNLIPGVTPSARLEYLFALASRIERALRAYCITGLTGLFARGKTSTNRWQVSVMVPPAVKALRPRIARVASDLTADASESILYGATSGSGAADEVVIPSPHARGIDDSPPEGALAIAAGSQVYDDTPAAAMDRLLESPTATSMSGPARERIEILRGVGVTLTCIPAGAAAL